MDDLEIKESFSNRVGAVEQEIEVLVKAQEIAVQSRENLPKEISQREAERHILELTLALALKKINENKILCEDKNALELLVRKKKASKHALRRKFQAEKDKWNDLSNVRALNLAGKLKKMESEMKGKLLEMEGLMDFMQKKNEADRLQLKEAHKECNALKLEIQELRTQAEGRANVYIWASTKFKEMESMKRELLEKELLMDLSRKKDEGDSLHLKEAHELECNALKLEIQELRTQAEGRANVYIWASTKFKEMESMKRELLEKELLMDLSRKKDEGDSLHLKEAHEFECDALKSEVQELREQAGVRAHGFILTSTKFKEMESKMKRELLEKELLMDLTRKKDEADSLHLKEAHELECNALKLEIQELRTQAEGPYEPFPTAVIERKPNVGDVPTANAQENQQAGTIRLRVNQPNVAVDVPVKPRSSRKFVLGQEARITKRQKDNMVFGLNFPRLDSLEETLETVARPPQNY